MTQDDTGCAPMLGSQPVAWAVTPGTLLAGQAWRVTLDKDEAERISCGAMLVVPLYERPQAAITGQERSAIEEVIAYLQPASQKHENQVATTLRGLLERLG